MKSKLSYSAKHTTAYFKDVIYYYPVSRAVQEGYLVDWNLVRINSDIRMMGLFLEEGEEVQFIDPATGEKRFDVLEDEREYDSSSLERKATAPESNSSILKEYAKYAREFEKENGHFPKTLIFAVNDLPHTSHCDTIVDILSYEFVDKGAGFVKKITGKVDRPLHKIREFRNRPEEPAIVVTVDMLSTGVDIPTIETVLFLRPVKSRILYEQMMGRGTRLAKDIGIGLGDIIPSSMIPLTSYYIVTAHSLRLDFISTQLTHYQITLLLAQDQTLDANATPILFPN